jgi:hypothetical protein
MGEVAVTSPFLGKKRVCLIVQKTQTWNPFGITFGKEINTPLKEKPDPRTRGC